ncbi:(Fe-S)-binding protein, partial [Bdellovibrionota bacterium FG-2]
RFTILYRMMKAHQGKANRWDQLSKRVQTFISNVLGQRAVLQRPGPGIMHATIFWGFLLITLGTLEQFVSTIYQPANFEFLGKAVYGVLVFFQDFFTVGILVALAYACYRRFVVRPEGLGRSRDANIILLFTSSLMVAILLMNAFHILAYRPWYADNLIFSNALAERLSRLALSQDFNASFATFFKWVHMLIVLGFAMYIPSSKHLHVIAAAPNTFLRTLSREKGMTKINFEDESVTQYGAAKVTDLDWKDVLDYYSCTECGRCQDLCPAYNTQKPLSPKALISDLKGNMYRNKAAILAHKYDEVSSVIDENITDDVIWACTSCRACEIACPVFIEQTDKIFDIRRNLVMMESRFPSEVQAVFKNMETNASPWAFSSSDRANWAQGLGVKTMAEESNVEVLLWVG